MICVRRSSTTGGHAVSVVAWGTIAGLNRPKSSWRFMKLQLRVLDFEVIEMSAWKTWEASGTENGALEY